ncbi:unnamed protein product [Thelazia callipaeda]|uniref:BRCT domain-containing protein n=1 Tax=Thelazia callipaeda TaxID=103827 RepID=A0A0N5D6B0_THECL|nr:unnamed protein product [Thelazia callipaeda]
MGCLTDCSSWESDGHLYGVLFRVLRAVNMQVIVEVITCLHCANLTAASIVRSSEDQRQASHEIRSGNDGEGYLSFLCVLNLKYCRAKEQKFCYVCGSSRIRLKLCAGRNQSVSLLRYKCFEEKCGKFSGNFYMQAKDGSLTIYKQDIKSYAFRQVGESDPNNVARFTMNTERNTNICNQRGENHQNGNGHIVDTASSKSHDSPALITLTKKMPEQNKEVRSRNMDISCTYLNETTRRQRKGDVENSSVKTANDVTTSYSLAVEHRPVDSLLPVDEPAMKSNEVKKSNTDYVNAKRKQNTLREKSGFRTFKRLKLEKDKVSEEAVLTESNVAHLSYLVSDMSISADMTINATINSKVAFTQTEMDDDGVVNLLLDEVVKCDVRSSITNRAHLLRQIKVAQTLLHLQNKEICMLKEEKRLFNAVQKETKSYISELKKKCTADFLRIRDEISVLTKDFRLYLLDLQRACKRCSEKMEEDKMKFIIVANNYEKQNETLNNKIADLEKRLELSDDLIYNQKRELLVADREMHLANENVADIQKKLEDKLFLASHAKCTSCTVFEKLRDTLTTQIVDKTNALSAAEIMINELKVKLEKQERASLIMSKEIHRMKFERSSYVLDFKRLEAEVSCLRKRMKEGNVDLNNSSVSSKSLFNNRESLIKSSDNSSASALPIRSTNNTQKSFSLETPQPDKVLPELENIEKVRYSWITTVQNEKGIVTQQKPVQIADGISQHVLQNKSDAVDVHDGCRPINKQAVVKGAQSSKFISNSHGANSKKCTSRIQSCNVAYTDSGIESLEVASEKNLSSENSLNINNKNKERHSEVTGTFKVQTLLLHPARMDSIKIPESSNEIQNSLRTGKSDSENAIQDARKYKDERFAQEDSKELQVKELHENSRGVSSAHRSFLCSRTSLPNTRPCLINNKFFPSRPPLPWHKKTVDNSLPPSSFPSQNSVGSTSSFNAPVIKLPLQSNERSRVRTIFGIGQRSASSKAISTSLFTDKNSSEVHELSNPWKVQVNQRQGSWSFEKDNSSNTWRAKRLRIAKCSNLPRIKQTKHAPKQNVTAGCSYKTQLTRKVCNLVFEKDLDEWE